MSGIMADARRVTPSEFLGFLRAPREETLEDLVRDLSTAVWAGDKDAIDKARERIARWNEPLVDVEQLETRNGRARVGA